MPPHCFHDNGFTGRREEHNPKWRGRESNPQSRRFELRRFADLRTAPFFPSDLDGI